MTDLIYSVFFVEDKGENFSRIEDELKKAGMLLQLTLISDRASFLLQMQKSAPDLVLVYCGEGDFAGMECLQLYKQLAPQLPLIMLSPSLGEWAIEAMREGAADVLLHDKLDKLPAAITRALREAEGRRQQQQTEESLQLSYEHLRNLFKMSPVGVFRCDPDKNCFYVNDRFCELTGLKPEEAFGTGWIQALHPEDKPMLLKQWYAKKGVLEEAKAIYRYQKPKTGEVTWVIGQSISETDRQGRLLGYLGSVTDITRLKVAEEALIEKNEYLLKVNQELDNFVYSASHNLRAPLTSLMGLINLIRLELQNPEALERMCGMMEHSLHRLDGFIRDILDHSRNARLSMQYQQVDARALLEETLQEFSLQDGFSEIDVQLHVQQQYPFNTDPGRLRIILRNLLSNCIRYRARHQKSQIVITLRVDPAETSLQVNDNGIGIRKEHQARIFEMFYRADDQRSGSGLGLYITREIVHKLGGTIHFESEYSKGTSVRVVLPNQQEASEAQTQEEMTTRPGLFRD